jgi:hypothetical protein
MHNTKVEEKEKSCEQRMVVAMDTDGLLTGVPPV